MAGWLVCCLLVILSVLRINAFTTESGQKNTTPSVVMATGSDTNSFLVLLFSFLGAAILIACAIVCSFHKSRDSRSKKRASEQEATMSVYSISSALQATRPTGSKNLTSSERRTKPDDVTQNCVLDGKLSVREKRRGQFGLSSSLGSISSLSMSRSNLSVDTVATDADPLTNDDAADYNDAHFNDLVESDVDSDDLTGVENAAFFFSDEMLNTNSTKDTSNQPIISSDPDVDNEGEKRLSQTLKTSVMARMLLNQPGDKPKVARKYKKNPEAHVRMMSHKAAQRWTALQVAYEEMFRENISPLKLI